MFIHALLSSQMELFHPAWHPPVHFPVLTLHLAETAQWRLQLFWQFGPYIPSGHSTKHTQRFVFQVQACIKVHVNKSEIKRVLANPILFSFWYLGLNFCENRNVTFWWYLQIYRNNNWETIVWTDKNYINYFVNKF